MPQDGHRAKRIECVACAVITVSDTRTPETDGSGSLTRELVTSSGHEVTAYEILPDDPDRVRNRVVSLCRDDRCQAVLLSGGTGLSTRDSTFEAVDALLEKRLDGFGELFRMLSYEQVGAAAMLSRATAGVCGSTLVFSMPGAPDAVRLAMEKLILPELPHVAWLVST